MKALTPRLPGFLALSAALGAQACFSNNTPSYRSLEETLRSDDTHDDAEPADDVADDDGPADDTADDDAEPADDVTDDDSAVQADDDRDDGDDDPSEPEPELDVDSGVDPSEEAALIDAGPGPYTGEVDPNSEFYPPCGLTLSLSGEEIKKGTACTPDDPQLCYRECGPFQIGWKTENCLAGVYAEGDCTFPEDGDYSCFAIPDEIDTSVCPTDIPPKSTDVCDVPECTLCNLNSQYFDTANNAKEGYCVCREADETGLRTWTCASTTAWPCPFSRGC